MRAIGLFSGGLDSSLAICIVRDMGIEIEALYFYTGLHSGIDSDGEKGEILAMGKSLGMPVKILDISEELLDCILHPRFGYGSGMNPCLDCRLMMLIKAREYLKREPQPASFIVTGEVLGQRPMSQYRRALMMLEKESGLEGLILRPLSGKLLPETIPEREGWVKREKLFSIQGKSRREQIALAKEKGIVKYTQPAGGCLLTDSNYSRKLKDLINSRGKITAEDLNILKVGRHLRINSGLKVIVGRNHAENCFLEKYKSGRWVFRTVDCAGPVTLLEGESGEEELKLAAGITAGYSDVAEQETVRVSYERDDKSCDVCVKPIGKPHMADWFI